jgi:uncharacterized membrane protein
MTCLVGGLFLSAATIIITVVIVVAILVIIVVLRRARSELATTVLPISAARDLPPRAAGRMGSSFFHHRIPPPRRHLEVEDGLFSTSTTSHMGAVGFATCTSGWFTVPVFSLLFTIIRIIVVIVIPVFCSLMRINDFSTRRRYRNGSSLVVVHQPHHRPLPAFQPKNFPPLAAKFSTSWPSRIMLNQRFFFRQLSSSSSSSESNNSLGNICCCCCCCC